MDFATQVGQLKTGQGEMGLLLSHLLCLDDLPRLWDRIDRIEGTSVLWKECPNYYNFKLFHTLSD